MGETAFSGSRSAPLLVQLGLIQLPNEQHVEFIESGIGQNAATYSVILQQYGAGMANKSVPRRWCDLSICGNWDPKAEPDSKSPLIEEVDSAGGSPDSARFVTA